MDLKILLLLFCAVQLSLQLKYIPPMYRPFTRSTTGCPCWWDLTRTKECACCKPGYTMQCGYPKHNYCYRRMNQGCPGIKNARRTLSETGYQCFNSKERSTECAWCVPGNFQCGRFKVNNICGAQAKWCGGVRGDCKHIPNACDPNARCLMTKRVNKWVSEYKCRCNRGYTGNGVQCFDSEGKLGIDPKEIVSVSMKINSDYYRETHEENEFPNGAFMEGLMNHMSSANSSCTPRECEVTYSYSPDQE